MRLPELIATLDQWDRAGIWAFSSTALKLLFPESDRTRLKALAAHQKTGVITHIARGLYINPKARSLPTDLLSQLVVFLRPWYFNYLSLESALSEAGWMSQIPSRLTVMTTGRSQVFDTPYGTIEFTHTAQAPEQLRAHVNWDANRQLWIATPEQAQRDLKRVGRNLDLLTPILEPDHANSK